MLKSGEMSPTLFPTRPLAWSSAVTAVGLLADGVAIGNGVFDPGLDVDMKVPHAIFVHPKTPLEQKQLLQ